VEGAIGTEAEHMDAVPRRGPSSTPRVIWDCGSVEWGKGRVTGGPVLAPS